MPFKFLIFKKVAELNLSVRATNCLENENIVYVGELV
jgi:DNA-directed RNA polymerase alpha subunit